MMHSWPVGLLALVCCASAAVPAFAQSDADPAAAQSGPSAEQTAGDPAAGRVKFNSCVGCHGIPGYNNAYPTYNVPKLGGQHAAYIVSALQAYASGAREHPTMNAQASSLSEQDIRDIAAYLSQAGSQ